MVDDLEQSARGEPLAGVVGGINEVRFASSARLGNL